VVLLLVVLVVLAAGQLLLLVILEVPLPLREMLQCLVSAVYMLKGFWLLAMS
jgi:hypothetical protein